jgi:hypothetical protein
MSVEIVPDEVIEDHFPLLRKTILKIFKQVETLDPLVPEE